MMSIDGTIDILILVKVSGGYSMKEGIPITVSTINMSITSTTTSLSTVLWSEENTLKKVIKGIAHRCSDQE